MIRIKIGDMELDDQDRNGETSYHERAALTERIEKFLKVAENCYVERYGMKPERDTVEEF